MARSTSDEEIKLRKVARRRLIGAIALTTLVVVALPMVLDSEPRPIGDDIAVQIPSPNSGPFAPKAPAADPAKAAPAAKSVPAEVSRPPAEAPKAGAATASAPAPASKAPAAAGGETPKAQVSGTIASAVAPGDMNISVAGAPRPGGDTPAKSAPAAIRAEPASGRAEPVKPAAELPKPAPAAPAAASSPAASPPAGGSTDAAKKGSETFVIQLGAFADVSRARERHAQLVKAGVRSYTEVIKTPTGDKTRVRAGPFPTREAADSANERVKTLGMTDGVVVTRRY
jgi:DedD protein